MATWKDIGEVADSDDESLLDSEESQQRQLTNADNLSQADELSLSRTEAHDHSIWDIPSSSQPEGDASAIIKSSGLPPPQPELQLQSPPQLRPESPAPAPSSSREDSPLSSLPSSPELTPRASHVGTRKTPDNNSPVPVSVPEPASSRASPQIVEPVWDLADILAIPDTEVTPRNRSFRPRKPVQEHPYLVEDAKYRESMKSHGYKPTRVRPEDAHRKQQGPEEESQEQDQDYEEESQETAKDETQLHQHSSQLASETDIFGEIDELALSSPDPPRTRPHTVRASPRSDHTSDDDDLPDISDISKWKPKKLLSAKKKRHASPKASSKRKLSKFQMPTAPLGTQSPSAQTGDIYDEIPISPPQTSPALNSATTPFISKKLHRSAISSLTPKPSSTNVSREQSLEPATQNTRIVDLRWLDDDEDDDAGSEEIAENMQVSDNDNQSESDDGIQRFGKRMKGVLPASWLRIDQQNARPKPKPNHARRGSPERSPERTQRKGVAQRRQVKPKPGLDDTFFLDLDDDDNESTLRPNETNSINNADHDSFPIFDDDPGSAIEDDEIDRMLPPRKRASTGTDAPRKRQKNQQRTFSGQTGQKRKQQRITGLLGPSKPTATGGSRKSDSASRGRKPNTKQPTRRPRTPPRLSILDVMDPDSQKQPDFVRIAARTAKKRADKGKSSPSHKIISLGTRRDNIDATQVLQRWKEGKIKERPDLSQNTRNPSSAALQTPTQVPSHALQPISDNPVPRPRMGLSKGRPPRSVPSTRFSQPRRFVKQASMDAFVSADSNGPPSTISGVERQTPVPRKPRVALQKRAHSHVGASRPAQLETAGEVISRHAFNARKKALDALYRKSARAPPSLTSLRLERALGNEAAVSPRQPRPQQNPKNSNDSRTSAQTVPQPRQHRKKKGQPRHIDTDAPQYVHANDPMPREPSSTPSIVTSLADGGDKLQGLAPYGTPYTQHFEIFPLDPCVFFHESTLLGSGRLAKTLDEKNAANLDRSRDRRVFALGEKVLRWGPWEAQTSSEFGIIFDWILDCFQADSNQTDGTDQSPQAAILAADFVLDYLQRSISFPDPTCEKAFADRMVEVLQSFVQRLESPSNITHCTTRSFIEVLSRALIIQLHVLRLCRVPRLMQTSFHLEDTMKQLAAFTGRTLLRDGLGSVRKLYDSMQHATSRDRGIRGEHYSASCWVTLILALQEARILRGNFGDIMTSVLINTNLNSVTDASYFESIWHSLFTLLPLGDFDANGVIISGHRHSMPLESWSLPQKLLGRVFQLYKTNPRQPPSFNDYCRGIVSRCHYLVDQWGWRKSSSVIGTIFDFFASQALSNLRNETAYSSPRFLEELAASPNLAIQPEDRCFHIFLKFLALSIQRLRKFSLLKDVKNLVARVLPNHNRQYSRENEMRDSDLGALRNHHDLLCTLFWAAPPEFRPSVQLIQKQVDPATSHKEACLVTLRAWNQLARFIISSGEGIEAYTPFGEWHKHVFLEVLGQYQSAESDLQQQLDGLSTSASKDISQEMMKGIVKANKQVAMDVIHFSMKAVLDVVHHARNSEGACAVLLSYPLEKILVNFTSSAAERDWTTLQVAADIIAHYLKLVDQNSGSEDSQGSDLMSSGDETILFLEHKIAIPFFRLVRKLVGFDPSSAKSSNQLVCFENMLLVSARLAVCLAASGIVHVSDFFKSGHNCQIFDSLNASIDSPARRHLTLFLATLIEGGVVEFGMSADSRILSPLDIFLWAITKPSRFLAHENRLAEAMKRNGSPYLQDTFLWEDKLPDYNSNRDLFCRTVSEMRREVRRAEPNKKQVLQNQFAGCLRSVMKQIKADLKLIVSVKSEHLAFMEFIQSIIGIIRHQDLCPVDPYFYQISPEYAPSNEDPRLQTSSILALGLKLEDGDTKVARTLFHLVYPNFKIALANGRLDQEATVLERGMQNWHIYSWTLNRMFPAIIQAAAHRPEAWILLETYLKAWKSALTEPGVHREIDPENMAELASLIGYTAATMHHFRGENMGHLSLNHMRVITEILALLNLLSPSITSYLLMEPDSDTGKSLEAAIDVFTGFTRVAETLVIDVLEDHDMATDPINISSNRFFAGMGSQPIPVDHNELVDEFAKQMVKDIAESWICNDRTVTVKGPARPSQPGGAPPATQGTKIETQEARNLARNLCTQLREWNFVNDRERYELNRRRKTVVDELDCLALLF